MRLLDERYLNYPTEDVLQMQDYLRTKGYQINHKRGSRLLRAMAIMAIYQKRNLSKQGKAEYAPAVTLPAHQSLRPPGPWLVRRLRWNEG